MENVSNFISTRSIFLYRSKSTVNIKVIEFLLWYALPFRVRRRNRMVVEFTITMYMQSVPITTNVVSLNPAHGQVYSIKHYVIKFVSDLIQVCGFRRVLRFLPPIKLIATRYNLNIVESGTIILTLHFQFAFCYKTKSKLFFFSLLESNNTWKPCLYKILMRVTLFSFPFITRVSLFEHTN